MRELLILRIIALLGSSGGHADADRQRWLPVKEWILNELLKKEIRWGAFKGNNKKYRKEIADLNLDNLGLILFTAQASDVQVIELFELTHRRFMTQR